MISSDKFCRRLLGSKFEANKSLYEQIKNKTWYVSLETDPTVIAIMEMTKQIELTNKEELTTSPRMEKIEALTKEAKQTKEIKRNPQSANGIRRSRVSSNLEQRP